MAAWTESNSSDGVSDRLHDSYMAITTVLMMKRVFGLSLRALQCFVKPKLIKVSLHYLDYSLISKRAKTVNTDLKVFGEGEWKIRQQHGVDKLRV